MFDGKVLIKRLPSFSVPKIMVIRHVKPILKLQQTWQTRNSLMKKPLVPLKVWLNSLYDSARALTMLVELIFEWRITMAGLMSNKSKKPGFSPKNLFFQQRNCVFRQGFRRKKLIDEKPSFSIEKLGFSLINRVSH